MLKVQLKTDLDSTIQTMTRNKGASCVKIRTHHCTGNGTY